MTLQSELDKFKENFKTSAPVEAQRTMAQATRNLADSGILDKTVKAGDTLPPFALPNQDGNEVSLKSLLEDGPLVINVFRGVWCPYCSIELKALNRYLPELEKRRARLVAIAPQLQASAKKNKETLSLDFDILVDQGNQYAQQLGLCYRLPDELIGIYKQFGIDLPAHNGDESWQLPMPARLVVNQDGVVAYADINPDYTVRPEPEKIAEVLDREK